MKKGNTITGILCVFFVFSTLNAQISVHSDITNTSCYNSKDGAIDVTVSGGTTPYEYYWSNGSTTEDLNNLEAGIYSLTITDAAEEQYRAGYQVKAPAPIDLEVYINEQNICPGETTFAIAAATGGTGTLSYSWNDPQYQTGVRADQLSGGSYTVVVTDENNCIASSNFSIYEPDPIKITEMHKNITCPGGNDGIIFSTINGGTAPYNYIWSNNETTKNLTGLTAGNYSLTVTDNHGCTGSKNVSLSEENDSSIFGVEDYLIRDITCYDGANGEIEVIVNDSIKSSLNFLWHTENGSGVEEIDTNKLTGLSAGTYALTITDENGCMLASSHVLSHPPKVIIDSADVVLPTEEHYGSIHVYASGGAGDLRYSINSGKNYYNNNGVFSQVPPGRYLIAVKDITDCEVFGNVLKISTYNSIFKEEEEEQLQEGEMHIYPNPSDGLFYVEFKNSAKDDFLLDVYNMNGQKVYSRYYQSTADHVWVELNLADNPPGLYLIYLKGSNTIIKNKVFIR